MVTPQSSRQQSAIAEEVHETSETEALHLNQRPNSPAGDPQHIVPRLDTHSSKYPWRPPRRRCGCDCHGTTMSLNRTGYWTLPYNLSYSYMSYVVQKKARCQKCICFRSQPTVKVNFRCPSWFWGGVVSGSLSFGGQTGLSISLRPTVFVLRSKPVWGYINSDHVMTQRILRHDGLALTDTDEFGGTILEVDFFFPSQYPSHLIQF